MEGCDALLVVGSGMPYIQFWHSPGRAVGVQIDGKSERIVLRYATDVGLVRNA
ncbi:MAG TPA: hypothetical protein VF731_09370 [Solirubrobacterales bacterium]